MPISIKMHSIAVTRVCVCACARARDRMSIPICICALDPGLYKNLKYFTFILDLQLFLTKDTKTNFWNLNGISFFYTPL